MTSILHRMPIVESRPAVIIGGELNGLGVCRSLAKGGVSAHVLDRKRFNAAMWSGYARPFKASALHGRALLDSMRALRASLTQRPVLIITDELALLTISEFRDELKELFLFHLPSHKTVMMLHNKAQFHEYATARGFTIPRGEVIRDQSDIRRIQSLRFPVFIKPADKRFFHSGDVPRLGIAADWKSAEIFCRRLLAVAREIIVQEQIDGPDAAIYFCLFYRGEGGATTMFTGRKLASSPPQSGSTALCMIAEEARKILEGKTQAFLDETGYAGFGSIEFKWDAASSRFAIIEPTVGRTDWQEEIATLSGVNIPLSGYYQECGRLQSPWSPIGKRIVWQASWVERIKARSELIPGGVSVVDGYWRRDDPLPAVIHYPQDIVISAPAILTVWGARLRHWCDGHLNRLGRLFPTAKRAH